MSQLSAVKAAIAHSVPCAELRGSSAVRAEARRATLFMIDFVLMEGMRERAIEDDYVEVVSEERDLLED